MQQRAAMFVPLLLALCLLGLIGALSTAVAGDSALSGVLKDGNGVSYVGTTVGLYAGTSPTPASTTTTNSSGRFYLTELAEGVWTVKPDLSGTTFSPLYRTYTLPPTVTNADFVGSPPQGSAISGLLKKGNGAAYEGVMVGLYAGTSGTPTTTTTTNADGRFYFTGLAAGTWTVKPDLNGTTFTPLYRTYTLPPTVTNADFAGAPTVTSTISGVVKTGAGLVVANVPLGLYQGDTPKGSTTTNAEGRYTFANLAAGTYVVRPQLAGKVFTPTQRTPTVPPSVITAHFVIADAPVLSAISGVIRNGAGQVVPGVPVKLNQSGEEKKSTTTNAQGRYYFTDLLPGSYTVRPGQAGSLFEPASRNVAVPPTVTNADFAVAPKPLPPTLRSGGVNPATGNTSATFTYTVLYTDALNRAPTCAKVIIDESRVVSMVKLNPSDTGFTDGCVFTAKVFLPLGTHLFRFAFAVGDLILRLPTGATPYNGPTVSGEEVYYLVGYIKVLDSPLEGVTVTITREGAAPLVVTTNADGRFAGKHLAPGLYTVSPAKEGYIFSPPQREVTLGPTVLNCNFGATAD